MQPLILGLILAIGAPIWGLLAYATYLGGNPLAAAALGLLAGGGFIFALLMLRRFMLQKMARDADKKRGGGT